MQQEVERAKTSTVESNVSATLAWRVIGLLAFAAPWVWTIKGKADLGTLADAGSLTVVGVCPLALLLVGFGWKGMTRAVTTLLRGSVAPQANLDASPFFQLAAAFSLGCGFLATLVGLLVMLQNMSDPSAIGPAIAVAMLPQVYGVVMALLSLVAATLLARRERFHEGADELDHLGRQSVGVAGIAAGVGVSAILLVFSASMLSMSEIKRDPRFERTMGDLRAKFAESGVGDWPEEGAGKRPVLRGNP